MRPAAQRRTQIERRPRIAAQTNALDPVSVFLVVTVTHPGASCVQLTWSSVPGVQYEILATTNLAVAFSSSSAAIPAAGATTTWLDNPSGPAPKFYKVRVVP